MAQWLSANLGTIIISLILAGIVIAVIVSKIRAKKEGKSSCGCGCANCAMHGACHMNRKSR